MVSLHSPVDLADVHTDLEKVFEVSVLLDFPFTLDEVATYFLPNLNLTAKELRSMLSNSNFADIPFLIQDGYLLTSETQSQALRSEREQMSVAKLNSAAEFAQRLSRLVPFISTIAVTGSVAYGSAGKWDDIDLFIVTERNRLWLSVFMALILVRAETLLGFHASHLLPFCLSYVHDEQGFTNDSLSNRANPLFARELLKAKPVVGKGEYRRLLEANSWIGKMFRAPYASKLKQLEQLHDKQNPGPAGFRRKPSVVLDWAEAMIFTFLSRYLGLRAYLTNLKLKSRRQTLQVFEPRITNSSCVYTSNFYKWLHSLWGRE